MFTLDMLGALLVCASTLMIFSFLYKDNPFYKFGEHVFVGISAGYGVALVWFQVLKPNLVDRLWIPLSVLKQRMFEAGELSPAEFADYQPSFGDHVHYAHGLYLVFLLLGLMMLFKISQRLNWISRWPLAYVIGAFAGIQVIQATQGSLIPQLQATMKDFSGRPVVVAMIHDTPMLPAAELDAREKELRQYMQTWYGEEIGNEYAAWLVESLMGDMRDSELFRTRPREVFLRLPLKLDQLLLEAERVEERLCTAAGGESPRRALARARLLAEGGGAVSDSAVASLAASPDSLSRGWPVAGLDHLELLPWQDRRLGLMFRISQENLRGEKKLAMLLSDMGLPGDAAARGAEVLSRPSGRPSLIQLFKQEGIAAGTQVNWENPRTVSLADSLLGGVNPRADHLSEWTPAQIRDLEARLASAGGMRSLVQELKLRLDSLDGLLLGEYQLPTERREALRAGVLSHWVHTLVLEADQQRHTELVEGVLAYCKAELLTDFSEAELQAFREDPQGIPPIVSGLDDGSATTFGRLSQSVVGLLGLDLRDPADSLRLRILLDILSNLLVLVGVCTGVFYFFFSKKQEGGLGVVSKVGIAFLMMSFGASFGYTVMGRISLAIGRMQDLLLFPQVAGICLLVLVVALVIHARLNPETENRR